MSSPVSNVRPAPDQLLVDLADYALNARITSDEAYDTARWCLADTLACGIMALAYPACMKLLGPVVDGVTVKHGARVPGTGYQLDPVQGAFNIGTIIRWLDFNDTWLAAEWGHPSDNLGAILGTADWLSRHQAAGAVPSAFHTPLAAFGPQQISAPGAPSRPARAALTMLDVLTAMVKAHEIQGVLALENSFNRAGLDHVLLVRVASTAVTAVMLGATREQVINALSHAWLDGSSLRTYRHAPNTGSRKSWAAGDATSRAVRLALTALTGEMGYPSVLTAKTWGFQDVSFKGQSLRLARPLGSYVMEQVLFKISFPAEFHAQTAVECAVQLHPLVRDRLDRIERIELTTHESAIRIIDKSGPLHNPADRDHCLQYMTAIGLLFGGLTADHYEDKIAADPRIDALRAKMTVTEDKSYTKDYLDPDKRSIANAVQVFFQDGTKSPRVAVEYPIGHRRRRDEGIPLLRQKALAAFTSHYGPDKAAAIMSLFTDRARLEAMPVHEFMSLLCYNNDLVDELHEQMQKDKEREQKMQYAAWCKHFATFPPDFVPKLCPGLKPEIELAPMRWMRLGLDLIKSAHGTPSIQLSDGKQGPHLQTYLPYPVFQAGTEIFLKGMWLAQHAECRVIESNDYVSPELRKKYQNHLKKLDHDLLRIVTALEQVPLYQEEGSVAQFLKIISGVTREYYYPLTKEDAAWGHARYPRRFYDDVKKVGHADQYKSYPEQWTLVLLFQDIIRRIDKLWGITEELAKRTRKGEL